MNYYFLLLLILIAPFLGAQPTTGCLKGKVSSVRYHELLPGVTVMVNNTRLGTTTDEAGCFTLNSIQPGSYSVEFRLVGFSPVIKTDIQIKPGKITILDVSLDEQAMQTENITITGGYFQEQDLQSGSLVNFNAEEIRRSPGSMGDVSRILLALPSTAKVSDDNNDIIVRGGSAAENGFYIDGIPVPNINHFPAMGSTGGPIGILNVDYIDHCDFMPGNFSPQFGDRLSSIIAVKYREGNREQCNAKADLNWAGFGGGAEGPLPGKSGSWLASFRRSYLDLITKAENMGMRIQYGDGQTKIVLDPAKNQKISVFSLYAYDKEQFNRADAVDQGSSYYGSIDNRQFTGGITWQAIWSTSFYSQTTVSLSEQQFTNNFDDVVSGIKSYISDNREQNLVLKFANFYSPNALMKIEAGIQVTNQSADYQYTKFAWTNRIGIPEPDFAVKHSIDANQYSFYTDYTITPVEKLSFSLGGRYDYYDLARSAVFSPRVAATLRVHPMLNVHLSGGSLHQQMPLSLLSEKPAFCALPQIRANHVEAGADYLLYPDLKLSLDVYFKEYKNLPLSADDPTASILDAGGSGSLPAVYSQLTAGGRAVSRGIEILLQKKLSDSYYGLLSAAISKSKYEDLSGSWHNRLSDNQFTFSFVAGYKASPEWEFSLRWTYAGGCPYSPINITKSIAANSAVIDQDRINTIRYPAYHSLNFRIDKKFFFQSQSIDVYLSVWNAYNRKNVSFYAWNSDQQKIQPIYQWGLMPIFGIVYEL